MKIRLMNHRKTNKASQKELNDLETLLTLIGLDLVIQETEYFTGDDWLPLCNDIDSGEIYRNWFIWQDTEVTQEWEAYDHITNQRIIDSNLTRLTAKIDRIENQRNLQINN
ncbi:hypothetical protein [Okeania sp. KiyG1]|uniref:hypothetical protein n=1 Tax=Okeania sp. KiyG1 TaxID=2720165 RepID=UPI00198AE271|nr:hypothetical protein [Okeania sp. KiyG1]GGA50648.1 hypothetical protein CYANOKiyG1_70180 [Okeania sp. KiyG1]